ncbi:MAG: hypothetical protein ACXWFI_13770 [Methylobacter sp.]
MSFRKRGLGRGLEALLAEESAKEDRQQSVKERSAEEVRSAAVETDKQAAMVVAFFKGVQKEHHALLEEAENLKKMIEDFEAIIRTDLS